VGKNTARNGKSEHLPYCIVFSFAFQLAEVGYLPLSKKLYALMGKGIVKPRQSQARPVKVGNADLPGQALSAPNAVQVERIVFFKVNVDKVQNGKTLLSHKAILKEKTG
jgi:hypothetical protein